MRMQGARTEARGVVYVACDDYSAAGCSAASAHLICHRNRCQPFAGTRWKRGDSKL